MVAISDALPVIVGSPPESLSKVTVPDVSAATAIASAAATVVAVPLSPITVTLRVLPVFKIPVVSCVNTEAGCLASVAVIVPTVYSASKVLILATVGVSSIVMFSPLTPAIVGDSTPLVSSLASATVLL